jgi:hypothetical protein
MSTDEPDTARMWSARLRGRAVAALPPDQLLPDRQPAYVASWIYVFGVLTLAALVVVLASGAVLALAGPQWYHSSPTGHFVNSLHLWSVELFFFAMVVHLWGKFFMAAWRASVPAPGSPACWRFSPRSSRRSPGICRSRTSTRSGSPPTARTRLTPSGSAGSGR